MTGSGRGGGSAGWTPEAQWREATGGDIIYLLYNLIIINSYSILFSLNLKIINTNKGLGK